MKRLPGKKTDEIDHSPIIALLSDDPADIEEHYKSLPMGMKGKALVYLSTLWGNAKTAKLCGVEPRSVNQCRWKHGHYLQELKMIRSSVLEELMHQKAYQIAHSIDVTQIADDKKAQSVKALMDASDIARIQTAPPASTGDAEETVELFYRIKRRLKKPEPEEDDGGSDGENIGKVIDVTGEVEAVKTDKGESA